MIKIDEAVLEKAEILAKLRIEPSEREKTMREMEKLLVYTEKLNELMKYTDLVMLDIKHINSASHKILTGKENYNILSFAKYLESKNIRNNLSCFGHSFCNCRIVLFPYAVSLP